jgi:SCY1-like protein 1
VCLEILKGLDEATFAEMGEPLLVSLFGMNDRAVRATLLQNLQPLASKLSEANINGRLFDCVLTGFADSAPQLRELTLKSMLCFSHRLNDKNLNDRLMRCLTKLQVDPEPSIRTNTTIFLGRIATQLKDGSRARVLLPAFLKACRDPFPHARLAGLKSAAACTAYFDPPSVATKVWPIVATLLIDMDGSVRDAAFQCHDAFMKVLQVNAMQLKEVEDRRRNEMIEKQVGGGSLLPAGMEVLGAGAASLGGLTSSVAAWGAQKMWTSSTSMLGSSDSGAVNVPPEDLSGSMSKPSSVGRKEEEDFFDSLAPPSGSRVAAASSDGWGEVVGEDSGTGWGEDEEDDAFGEKEAPIFKAASFGSTSAGRRTGSASLSVSGLAGGFTATGGEKVAPVAPTSSFASLNLGGGSTSTTRTGLIKPVTDDDLFSMLNDTSATPSAFNRTATRLQVPPGVVKAAPFSSSLSDLGAKKPTGVGRARLQAKKLEASKASDWDDF